MNWKIFVCIILFEFVMHVESSNIPFNFDRNNNSGDPVICEQCTSHKRSFDKILSRKKRFLSYPMGSFIAISPAGVKAIVITSPRGYNFLAEIDFLYPLPTEPRFWRRKRPSTPKPATTKPPPTTIPPHPLPEHIHHDDFISSPDIDYHDHDPHYSWSHDNPEHDPHYSWSHDHPDQEVWNPDSGWKNDILETLAALGNSTENRRQFWENLANQFEDFNTQNNYYQDPAPKVAAINYEYPTRRNYDSAQSYRSKNAGWRPPMFYPNRPQYFRGQGRSLNLNKTNGENYKKRGIEEEKEFDIEDHQDWEHYHAHKDRRDLYDNFENLFKFKGFDIRSCIARTICEARHLLLPPGQSLFQDVFRMVFSVPTKDGMNDDYSTAMRIEDKEECWNNYIEKCPISILGMLLKTGLMDE